MWYKNRRSSFYLKSTVSQNSPCSHQIFGLLFARKFVGEAFKKSPNLVTLFRRCMRERKNESERTCASMEQTVLIRLSTNKFRAFYTFLTFPTDGIGFISKGSSQVKIELIELKGLILASFSSLLVCIQLTANKCLKKVADDWI